MWHTKGHRAHEPARTTTYTRHAQNIDGVAVRGGVSQVGIPKRHRHMDTPSHRRTDTQAHTDMQAHRHTDTQTRRHVDRQTLRCADAQRHRHTSIAQF